MPFQQGNQSALKRTPEDTEFIRMALTHEMPIEDIFAHMMRKRPDVHPITIYRWIEALAKKGEA